MCGKLENLFVPPTQKEIEDAVQAEDWLRFKESMVGLDIDSVRAKLINWLEVHDYSREARLQIGSVLKGG